MPLLILLPLGAVAGWWGKSKLDALTLSGMTTLYKPDPISLAPWALLAIGGFMMVRK